MSDQAKFEGLKSKLIAQNESNHGDEIRTRYGQEMVDQSNKKFKAMTQPQFDRAGQLAERIIQTLLLAMDAGDPAGDLALETARLHKDWLMIYWPAYSPEAHAGLGHLYVDDERFSAYYDQHRVGAARFLCDAILHFTQREFEKSSDKL